MAALHDWRLGYSTVDSRGVLRRLVSQSAARVSHLSEELETLLNDQGFVEAMAGDVMIPTNYGQYEAGKYQQVFARWVAEERYRCVNFAIKAVAAGLAKRLVRLAERQGQLKVEMVRAALMKAGVSDDQLRVAETLQGRQVRAPKDHG